MVAAEVKKLKGERVERTLRAKINLPVPAYIPPDYVPDDADRLKYYKELMDADEAKTQTILAHLQDLSGPLPQEVKNLTELFRLSARAGAREIYHVDWIDGKLELLFTRRFKMPPNLPGELFNRFGAEHVEFIKSKNGDGLRVEAPAGKSPVPFTQETLSFFENILKPQK